MPKWNKKVNKDVLSFIKFFLGKGVRVNQPSLLAVVRHFHLAFKCMDTEEVYDVLMQQLIKAIHKYDPKYGKNILDYSSENLRKCSRRAGSMVLLRLAMSIRRALHRGLSAKLRRGRQGVRQKL